MDEYISPCYAAMARHALDEHMPALLGRGGLALRARAQLAAARAALATTATAAALAADPSAVLAPLEAEPFPNDPLRTPICPPTSPLLLKLQRTFAIVSVH